MNTKKTLQEAFNYYLKRKLVIVRQINKMEDELEKVDEEITRITKQLKK